MPSGRAPAVSGEAHNIHDLAPFCKADCPGGAMKRKGDSARRKLFAEMRRLGGRWGERGVGTMHIWSKMYLKKKTCAIIVLYSDIVMVTNPWMDRSCRAGGERDFLEQETLSVFKSIFW